MKNYTTPRTLAESSFVCGYSTTPIAPNKPPVSRSERIAGVFVAVVVGVLLAMVLLHWSMQ
jgi:hypothetical protein